MSIPKRLFFLIFAIVVVVFVLFFCESSLKNESDSSFENLRIFLSEKTLNQTKSCNFQKAEWISQLAELETIKQENVALREAMGIGLSEDYSLEFAYVTGKNYFEDIVTINKGSKDGIEEGMTVVTSEKALVGRVLNVYEDFSEVMLVSDKRSIIDAEVLETGDYLIVKGVGGSISLESLNKESEAEEGNILITSAIGGNYDRGFIIGEISSLEDLGTESYKIGEVEPYFNIRDLDKVFIIKK